MLDELLTAVTDGIKDLNAWVEVRQGYMPRGLIVEIRTRRNRRTYTLGCEISKFERETAVPGIGTEMGRRLVAQFREGLPR